MGLLDNILIFLYIIDNQWEFAIWHKELKPSENNTFNELWGACVFSSYGFPQKISSNGIAG